MNLKKSVCFIKLGCKIPRQKIGYIVQLSDPNCCESVRMDAVSQLKNYLTEDERALLLAK